MLRCCGKMSDEKRNEMILVCDVLGFESLVDSLNNRKQAAARRIGNSRTFVSRRRCIATDASTQKIDGVGEPVRVRGTVKAPDSSPMANADVGRLGNAPNEFI